MSQHGRERPRARGVRDPITQASARGAIVDYSVTRCDWIPREGAVARRGRGAEGQRGHQERERERAGGGSRRGRETRGINTRERSPRLMQFISLGE